jgi:patatin-like phospholipase/acyl hydrolase
MELNKPLFVTSSDSDGPKKNKVFDTHGDGATLLAYAVRCSASAPTYFPPVDGRYMDGGLWANNPSMVAFTGAVRLGVPENEIRILSIGTNGVNPDGRKIPNRMTLLDWSKYLMGDFMFTGGESAVSFYLDQLATGRAVRIEPIVKKSIELDSLSSIPEILQIWGAEARTSVNVISTFIKGGPNVGKL